MVMDPFPLKCFLNSSMVVFCGTPFTTHENVVLVLSCGSFIFSSSLIAVHSCFLTKIRYFKHFGKFIFVIFIFVDRTDFEEKPVLFSLANAVILISENFVEITL